MTVGLLITNYNTWTLTSQCIENCIKYADDTIDQFVVVDDCSTEPFGNQFPEVTVIKHKENKGLVKSLNTGLAALHTDLIIIFDSDAWPLEPFIKKTKAYFSEHTKTGVAAYDTQRLDGTPAVSYEAEPDAMSLVLGQQLHARYVKLFQGRPKKITVYTCAMIIRKRVAEEIGGFDETYDWLDLDHDICMSAMQKGWKIGIVPVKAIHKGSGTPQKVSRRVIRSYQNRMKLLKKFGKYPAVPLLNSLVIGRLTIEWLFLQSVGRLKYSKEKFEDKIASRNALLGMFINGKI